MKTNRGVSFGIVLCAVIAAACSPAGSATSAPTTAASTAAPATSGPIATAAPATDPIVLPSFPAGAAAYAIFQPKAGAGTAVTGGAALFDAAGKTQVVIAVDAMGETMAAAIQAGTCGSLTPEIAYRLTDVTSGASTTTVDVPLATLLNSPYAINIIVAGSETESSLSCGQITAVAAP